MEVKKENIHYCLLPQYRSEVCAFSPGQLYWLRCNRGSQCTRGNFSSEMFLVSLGQESLQNWAFGKRARPIFSYCPKSNRTESHFMLGYCLRTESHQQHHLRAQSRAWLPSRGMTGQSCWRDAATAHSSLLWKQLSKHLDTPFHQPSTTSPNPATLNTKVTFKWSPACSWGLPISSRPRRPGTTKQWGNKLFLHWVCLWAEDTPFHQAQIWTVLVSASGGYCHTHKLPLLHLWFSSLDFSLVRSLQYSHAVFQTEQCSGNVLQVNIYSKLLLFSKYWKMLVLCRLQLTT